MTEGKAIGRYLIAGTKLLENANCRLATKKEDVVIGTILYNDFRYVLFGNWNKGLAKFKVYPLFRINEIDNYRFAAISHHGESSVGDFYGLNETVNFMLQIYNMVSPKMFSGTKDLSTGKLTGIAMGRECITIDGIKRTGIFALVDNKIVFELDPNTKKYLFKGKFESSGSGNRIVIDPDTGSLTLLADDIPVGRFNFWENYMALNMPIDTTMWTSGPWAGFSQPVLSKYGLCLPGDSDTYPKSDGALVQPYRLYLSHINGFKVLFKLMVTI